MFIFYFYFSKYRKSPDSEDSGQFTRGKLLRGEDVTYDYKNEISPSVSFCQNYNILPCNAYDRLVGLHPLY